MTDVARFNPCADCRSTDAAAPVRVCVISTTMGKAKKAKAHGTSDFGDG